MTLLLIFAWMTSPSWAAQAEISFIRGSVEVGKTGFKKASVKMAIEDGEMVKTHPDSIAIVTLEDGSLLKVTENAQLTIHTKGETSADLASGSVFAKIAKQKTPHFSIRTKSAVMGVRGTQFFAAYGKGEDVWMCVDEGEVAVEAEGKNPVIVEPGFGVFINKGNEITPPKRYEWTKNLNWNMDPNAGDVTDHSSFESGYKNLLKHNYD